MKLPKYIKEKCDKMSQGWTPEGLGHPIEKNPYIDFHGFAQWLQGQGYRPATVIENIRKIHKWNAPVSETTIKNFDDTVELLNEKRHNYNTNNHPNLRNWRPKIDRMSSDDRKNNRIRFSYSLWLAMDKYLNYKKSPLRAYMPSSKDVKKPIDNIKHGYITHDDFIRMCKFTKDLKLLALWHFLFRTGARIGETLQMKKTKEWFPNLIDGKIKGDVDKLFKITVPDSIAKKQYHKNLYIDDSKSIEIFMKHLQTIKLEHFVFSFCVDKKKSKNFDDLLKENIFLRKIMKEIMLNAGFDIDKINRMTLHGWRRSMIHFAYKESGDISLAQKKARHSNVQMTGRYLDYETEELEKSLQELQKKRNNKKV